VHPQKRIFIKKVLESTICRICEMKKYLVYFNYRAGSIYVHLDGLLFDLKYDPSVIEIPVPRYFKEDDQIPVDIVFKEKVEREGGKKKKGKKGGKKKKTEDDAPPKVYPSFGEKEMYIDEQLEKAFDNKNPVDEIVLDAFTLDIPHIHAIRLIQKNERGRQGRNRYLDFMNKINKQMSSMDNRKKLHNGNLIKATSEQAEDESAKIVQCHIRGILARKEIEKMREEEMIFLGMKRKPKSDDEIKNDPIKESETTRDNRKAI
jgi:hypothetical protein